VLGPPAALERHNRLPTTEFIGRHGVSSSLSRANSIGPAVRIYPELYQCVDRALIGSSRDQKTTLFWQLDLATKCCTRFQCRRGIIPFGFVESASRA